MNTGTVIVGAGQAGAQLATSLREVGYCDPITLIGDEPHTPYHRPPLSKDYMAGKLADSELPIRTRAYYQERKIDLLTGVSATRIRRESQQLDLDSGRTLDYEHLVLATGARNRRLAFDGGEPSNVHYLRTRDDADRLRTALAGARDVLIIGAGFIGLEFASVAAGTGARVTVVETADRVMGRAVSAETASYFAARHQADGTGILCGISVDKFRRDAAGRITGVGIGNTIRDVDLVVVGIGVIPNSELAADAGLTVDNGIVVDARLETCDPAISAIGDCAARRLTSDGARPTRVESVQNAADQARFLARRITGTGIAYDDVPWFWSHQAGCKLQIAGLALPTDESVVLGDPAAAHRFSIGRVRGGILTAVESVNSPGDHLASRRLLAAGTRVTDTQLRSPDFSLRAAGSTTPRQPAPQPSHL
jgi:3-phenylpropionate/trans-cinnamate dioxygenase ferredoxin reductase subunit